MAFGGGTGLEWLAFHSDSGRAISNGTWDMALFRLTIFGIRRISSQPDWDAKIHPAISVAGADLTLGFYGPNLCFGVSGDVWYWALKKHKKSIDAPNLFCLM
ncbi:hypothetical protein ABT104_00245 [Streptomyces mobaraensis]|uniref:hypothetical protein n=1 Tax=Streptomyces mobaraensis TaxID=35621 RepID=UPI003316B059